MFTGSNLSVSAMFSRIHRSPTGSSRAFGAMGGVGGCSSLDHIQSFVPPVDPMTYISTGVHWTIYPALVPPVDPRTYIATGVHWTASCRVWVQWIRTLQHVSSSYALWTGVSEDIKPHIIALDGGVRFTVSGDPRVH